MTTPSTVEGNAFEYNLEEDYDSEDYFNSTEATPDSNLVESVYYDIFPDVLIDEYVPAHAAPTIEANDAIEQSVLVEAVAADATLESEIAVEEEDTMSEWFEEEDEDAISEYSEGTWVESEDEDVISEYSEGTWVESKDEDMISEASEEAIEDEARVASGEELAIQDLPKSNAPFPEGTRIAREGVMIEAYEVLRSYAALRTPVEVGNRNAIEESGEEAVEAVEAVTTMIAIPAATSTSLIPMRSTSAVIDATGDSTTLTHDWEAFFGCSPMVILQECRTTLLNAVENFFIEVERFRIRLRRFINSVLGKWEATKVD